MSRAYVRRCSVCDLCCQRLCFASQNGTDADDFIDATAAGPNGTYIFVGTTGGDWNRTNAGLNRTDAGMVDWIAFKVDSERNILWKWQVSICSGIFPFV